MKRTFERTFLELLRILPVFSRQLWPAARFPGKSDRSSRIARDRGGSNLSQDRSRPRRVPGSSCYILITYLSGRQDREEGQSRRRRKIEVDGPRDPFVCGNGLPTEREGEGGSDGVMATRAGRARRGSAERERGGTGERTTPGACYFGPEARHARRRQAPRALHEGDHGWWCLVHRNQSTPRRFHCALRCPIALARLPPSAPRNDRQSVSISLRGRARTCEITSKELYQTRNWKTWRRTRENKSKENM